MEYINSPTVRTGHHQDMPIAVTLARLSTSLWHDSCSRFCYRASARGIKPNTTWDNALNDKKKLRKLIRAYMASADSWEGCVWTTSFGPRGLDLNGLKAAQARILAAATSGIESDDWSSASRWLEQLEWDALAAKAAAGSAVHVYFTDPQLAKNEIQRACEIESKYRTPVTWQPLRDLVWGMESDTLIGRANFDRSVQHLIVPEVARLQDQKKVLRW